MDTIIYLVLAVAVILFQVFSEKKKKELQKAQKYSDIKPGYDHDDSVEEDEEEMFDWSFSETVEETQKSEEIVPKSAHQKAAEKLLQTADAYEVDNSGSVYESPEISDFENKEGRKTESSPLAEGFDPKLFVIYSQIAEPKFRD